MTKVRRMLFQRSNLRLKTSVCVAIVALALMAGIWLRVVDLSAVPPGLDQDEACSAYDAFSILETGRDHHGHFLPLYLQAFNDYRMPLFEYSLVPLIGVFGLTTGVARLGAALWGTFDMTVIAVLAVVMLGWPGAAIAATLYALSPWQLPMSRFCHQAIGASATVNCSVLFFLLWLRKRADRWLELSGLFFGLSLYAYAITKAFTPFMILLLAALFWRDIKESWRAGAKALAIVGVLSAPQAVLFFQRSAEMQARFREISIFGQPEPLLLRLQNFLAAFASYFNVTYLFVSGDRGDHWTLLHPQGFGQLLHVQAFLVVLALIALSTARWRKPAILLLGWLMLAALPAALTVPVGAQLPETNPTGGVPTAMILISHRETLHAMLLTPASIFQHPNLRRDILAAGPWALLSALGFAALLEWLRFGAVAITVGAIILCISTFEGARFANSYFTQYPAQAAPYFQYGMDQVVTDIQKLDGKRLPVVITDLINQPYIYVLFYENWPPMSFLRTPVIQRSGLWGGVVKFDRFYFLNPEFAYPRFRRGVFVFQGDMPTPGPPVASIRYPDGRIAYNIVVK